MPRAKKVRQILPRQIPPKAIEREYAAALVRLVIRPARDAYAPAIEAVKEAIATKKVRQDYDPDEPRDSDGKWSGSGVDPDRERAGRAEDEKEARFKAYEAKEAAKEAAKRANATRRPLGELYGSAPRGWDGPSTGDHLTREQADARLAELAKQAAAARAAKEFGVMERLEGVDRQAVLRASYQKGETYPVSYDNLDKISLPGHLYRGMSAEEYDTTVAKGLGVVSDNRASFSGEGVSFGYDAATASSYANSSDRSPATTGKPTYIVEARATPLITYSGYASYPQTAIGEGLPPEHITRVFKFEATKDDDIAFHEIPVPPASKQDSVTPHYDVSDREKILRLIRQGAAKLKKVLSISQLENLAQKFAQRTQTYQRLQLARQVRQVLGADPILKDRLLSERLAGFVRENVGLVTRIPTRLHGDLESLVQQGVGEAWPSETLADAIEARFGIEERHARLIARDQTSKLYADVNHDRQKELGCKRFVWRTVHDERVRGDPTGKYPKALPSHYDLDGLEFSYDDPPQPEGADEPIMPGDDVQCFPGGTLVSSQAPVVVLYRRFYRGEGTVIKTDQGRVLTATPNHPILTSRGWRPAHLVEIGDYVIEAAAQGVETPVTYGEHGDPSIEEVFAALTPLGALQTRRAMHSGFHGDASVNEKVDIINVNRCLSYEWNHELAETFCQDFLARASRLGLRRSSLKPLFQGLGSSSGAIVSCGSQLLTSLLGHSAHADEHRAATIARLYTIADELRTDSGSIDAKMLRDALHAPPVDVELAHHMARIIFSITRRALMQSTCLHTPSAKELAEAVSIDVEGFGRLGDGVGSHQLTRVVEKSFCELSCHVYNMQTESSWYVAQGLIVHNCRCYAEPILDDALEGDEEEDGGDEADESSREE